MKKKKTAIIATFIMAISTAVVGTFAWKSISQTALNEKKETINPGGRLHDDFNGEDKDVYVENFTDAEDNTLVYARIKLYEYMEIGDGAGEPKNTSGKKAVSVVEGADISDPVTWYVHNPYGTDEPFHKYIQWDEGGKTTYMPTFKKQSKSLEADINGTLSGGDTGKKYGDYVDYTKTENQTKTADEIYDSKTIENQEHTAKETLNAEVITMADWKVKGCPKGEYWVYDTDGWAYWAQAIEPQTATGCLINGFGKTQGVEGEYYYAVNVVCQLVTQDEWGIDDVGNGYFTKGETASNDALYLLAVISDEDYKINITNKNNLTNIDPGDSMSFNARMYFGASLIDGSKFNWSVIDNKSAKTTIDSNGILTVGDDETSTSIIVRAESVDDSEVYALYIVHVNVPDSYGVEVSTTDTITKRSKIVVQGRTKQFKTEITKNGIVDNDSSVVWSVSGNEKSGTVITQTGELTVDAEETAESLTVKAICSADAKAYGTYEICVISELEYIPYVEVGSLETVYIDDVNWYVLAKSLDSYLLWSADCLSVDSTLDTAGNWSFYRLGWSECTARTFMNGDYYDSLTVLKSYIKSYTLLTRNFFDTTVFDTTEEKVFLLSEADVFGTTLNGQEADAKDYTYGEKKLVNHSEMLIGNYVGEYANKQYDAVLRSPYQEGTINKYAYYSEITNAGIISCVSTSYSNASKVSFRPALWVDLSSLSD